ncbi:MAG: hypothetical protein ACI945_001203 [Pseudohongiellaceae bacterium]|jgi:hypothetical protein
MKLKLILSTSITADLLPSGLSHAESLVDGIYPSGGDDNGKGKCTVSLKNTDTTNKFGDETFELES